MAVQVGIILADGISSINVSYKNDNGSNVPESINNMYSGQGTVEKNLYVKANSSITVTSITFSNTSLYGHPVKAIGQTEFDVTDSNGNPAVGGTLDVGSSSKTFTIIPFEKPTTKTYYRTCYVYNDDSYSGNPLQTKVLDSSNETESFTITATPSKAGYTFAGWVIDWQRSATYGEAIISGNTVYGITGGTTSRYSYYIYATWTKNTPTYYYIYNDGWNTGSVTDYTVESGSMWNVGKLMIGTSASYTVQLPVLTDNNSNYTFSGWYVTRSGYNPAFVSSGSSYTFYGAANDPDANSVYSFRASWEKNSTTYYGDYVIYQTSSLTPPYLSGTPYQIDSTTYTINISGHDSIFTREGYVFDNWVCSSADGEYSIISNYSINIELGAITKYYTFYGKWTKLYAFNWVWDVNNVNAQVDSGKIPTSGNYYLDRDIQSLSYTLPILSDTTGKKIFTGWKIERMGSNPETEDGGTSYTFYGSNASSLPQDCYYTLTAQWVTAKTATYYYDGGGQIISNASAFMGDTLRSAQDTVSFTFPTVKPQAADTNYTFDYWSISGGSITTPIEASVGETVQLRVDSNGNIIYKFTAKWIRNVQYTITFNFSIDETTLKENQVSTPVSKVFGPMFYNQIPDDINVQLSPTLKDLTATGNLFLGWYINDEKIINNTIYYKKNNLSTNVTEDQNLTVNYTIQAKWAPYQYTAKLQFYKNTDFTVNNMPSSEISKTYIYGKSVCEDETDPPELDESDLSYKFTFTVPSNVPTRSDSNGKFHFANWNTQPDDNGIKKQPEDTVTIIVNPPSNPATSVTSIGTIILYAIWQEGGIVWIYYNGSWARAVPYIYTGGSWKQARPWIYKYIGTDDQGEPIYEWR